MVESREPKASSRVVPSRPTPLNADPLGAQLKKAIHIAAAISLCLLMACATATTSARKCSQANGANALGAVATKRVPPFYPAEGKRGGIEGYADIAFRIDADGNVYDARVHQSQPPGMFGQAALDAVRQWKYCPDSDAAATGSTQIVRLEFQLPR